MPASSSAATRRQPAPLKESSERYRAALVLCRLEGLTHGEAADRLGCAEGTVASADVTHVNLNDGVIEGLHCRDVPAFSVQYHPEAGPGPHDAQYLFAEFDALMARPRGRG